MVLAATVLTCPHCGAPLRINSDARRAECPQGHHYDVAKQGYLNLLAGAATKHRSDTAEMLEHRDAFLNRNLYSPIIDAIATLLGKHAESGINAAPPSDAAIASQAMPPSHAIPSINTEAGINKTALDIADLGVGTGYYLDQLAQRLADAVTLHGTGLDLSVPALKRYRARRPADLAIAWDLWRPLPLAEASFDAAISIFSPRNISEMARILRPDGIAIFVVPESGHLRELHALDLTLEVPPGKSQHLETALAKHGFDEITDERITHNMHLDSEAIVDLIQMGPMAFHRSAAHTRDLVQQKAAQVTEVQLDVRVIGGHRRRSS